MALRSAAQFGVNIEKFTSFCVVDLAKLKSKKRCESLRSLRDNVRRFNLNLISVIGAKHAFEKSACDDFGRQQQLEEDTMGPEEKEKEKEEEEEDAQSPSEGEVKDGLGVNFLGER